MPGCELISFKPSSHQYRQALIDLYQTVLNCPKYDIDCSDHLKEGYQPGPEISFVGDKYGENGVPRILFTRIAPNWLKKYPDFGTRETITEYINSSLPKDIDEFYNVLLNYWRHPVTDQIYRGYRYWNTVVGHGNQSTDVAKELHEKPKYGIKLVLLEMAKVGLITNSEEVLDFCAINNLVKCSGRRPAGNPDSTLVNNCLYYFLEEVRILEPQILLSFGEEANHQILKRDLPGEAIIYANLPHPAFRPGPWNKKHPPEQASTWQNDRERETYKGCLTLRDQVKELVLSIRKVIGDVVD